MKIMKRLYAMYAGKNDGILYDEKGNVVKAKSISYPYTFHFCPGTFKWSAMDKKATEVVESNTPPLLEMDAYVLGNLQTTGNRCYCSVQYYVLEK
jgi:hypothetical protein